MVKKIGVKIMLALMLCVSTFTQNKTDTIPASSKPYWLNHSLIFSQGCLPIIFPDNIIFGESACSENQNLSRGTRGLSRGTKVKIYSIRREKGSTTITLRDWPELYELDAEYKIILRSKTENDFRNSFKLLFSQREVAEPGSDISCHGDLKTKAQVIKCFGFPMSVTKVGGVEEYRYEFWYVGYRYDSYESWTVKIKNNKVIEVGGSI